MATTVPGVVIALGSGPQDASPSTWATDLGTPYIRWQLPPGFQQRRFNARIASAEPGGFAFTTSGIRETFETSFQFPFSIGLNENFAGLCTVEVALSESTTGDMEWVSEPFYFVYDRRLERMDPIDTLAFSWNASVDSDLLPSPGQRLFQIEIAYDPLFARLAYAPEPFVSSSALKITHTVDRLLHLPLRGNHYLWRSRQSDGLDWGAWSKAQAFLVQSGQRPDLTIISTTPLNNSTGDIAIRFSISDSDSEIVHGIFGFERPGVLGRWPLSFVNPPNHLWPGEHTVIWRSNRDLPNLIVPGVVLFGAAADSQGVGQEVNTSPFTVDNSHVPLPGGGIGSSTTNFAVESILGVLPVVSHTPRSPVETYLATIDQIVGISRQQLPTAPAAMPWAGMGGISTIETGWENDEVSFSPNLKAAWSDVDFTSLVDHDPDPDVVTFPSGGGWLNPHAVFNRWMFASPVDYAQQSDAWPRPRSSRELGEQYLWGYIDRNGNRVEYPDAYDWDNRPAWHIGREVWGHNDAWVQIVEVHAADYPVCTTCDGRHWVPSPGPAPYTRLMCPNTSCRDGFDTAQELDVEHGQAVVKFYGRPVWHRLSHLASPQIQVPEGRWGLASNMPTRSLAILHIVGRHHSDFDVVSPRQIVWNLTDAEKEQLEDGVVTRQPDDGVDMEGHVALVHTSEQEDTQQVPVDGSTAVSEEMQPESLPASGYHGPLRSQFFWGVDPGSHVGHGRRPEPAQDWNARVGGDVGRGMKLLPLQFRFLQGWWDSYNTVHYQATTSASAAFHIQSAVLNQAGAPLSWQDLVAENAVFVPEANRWMIPPMSFHAFWDTARHLYETGPSRQLRVRQYDVRSKTFSEWAYSSVFRLLENVANPASVVSTEYEPWAKRIKIVFRVDDSENETYSLTRFWYSRDDGVTWTIIHKGDIAGSTGGLTSVRAGSQNLHTLWWDTRSYDLDAGDEYRIMIEALPSSMSDLIQLPFLRYWSPPNPVAGPAQQRIADILGTNREFSFDEAQQKWIKLDEPLYIPGELGMLTVERERVLLHPTLDAPEGYYSFTNEEEQVVDPSGYAVWLDAPYVGPETHDQAMRRIGVRIDSLVGGELPREYAKAIDAERYCRKRLIDQGFYAEALFNESGGEVVETITTRPTVNVFTDSVPREVTRYWKFRVQDSPEGPDAILDDDGYISPRDLTSLETVYYKIEMDPDLAFGSQPGGKPLRKFLTDHEGQRLSVATFNSGVAATDSNPAIDETQVDDGQPWDDQPADTLVPGTAQLSDFATAPTQETVVVGGALKITVDLLPGQQPEDMLPDGQAGWSGDYQWRLAAYNPVDGPVMSRPRPRITSTVRQGGAILLDYVMQAHDKITTASLQHTIQTVSGLQVTGYEVSRGDVQPYWTSPQQIDFVSDRRQPLDSSSTIVNQLSWIPRGTDRPRPAVIYHDRLMQYVMATSKKHFNDKWRICTSRAMAMPSACEYEALWEKRPEAAIYGPCLLMDGDDVRMYATTQTDGSPSLITSVSSDADTWATPRAVTGLGDAAYPSVVLYEGVYYAWYEQFDSGSDSVKIFHATSADGMAFTPANGGDPVLSGSGDVGSPSVVRLNGVWVMYFSNTEAGTISSAYSTDGVVWQDHTVEFVPQLVTYDGLPAMGTPSHPCVFIDLYRGNQELFMLLNFVLPSGESAVYLSMLESRLWAAGVTNKIFGSPGHLLDVPCTSAGVARQASVDAVSNLAPSGAKVRLNFSIWYPTMTEFHRQSEWVTASNTKQLGGHLSPLPWRYDESLLQLPYIKVST